MPVLISLITTEDQHLIQSYDKTFFLKDGEKKGLQEHPTHTSQLKEEKLVTFSNNEEIHPSYCSTIKKYQTYRHREKNIFILRFIVCNWQIFGLRLITKFYSPY